MAPHDATDDIDGLRHDPDRAGAGHGGLGRGGDGAGPRTGGGDPPPPPRTEDHPVVGLGLGRIVLLALACVLLGVGIDRVVTAGGARPSAVDLGFTRDMIDHHDQAVRMALATLDTPDIDPLVWTFASEILIYQRWEVGIMDTWLTGWGQSRGDEDRVAMTWMGMGVPVAQMPGMQVDAQMDALRSATGREADRLFLVMMREHHLGGVHMADEAAERASDGRVRELARRMSVNQRIEANEYTAALQRLGLQ